MRNKKLNIYKRKDGRYEGRVYLADGRNRSYKSFYGRTEKEAAEKLLNYLNDLEHGHDNCRCKRYFNDLLDEWLITLNIKDSSLCCYKTKIENHIRPYFTGMKYENVDETIMQTFLIKLNAKGLSNKYIGDILAIVKSFAKWVQKKYHCENKITEISAPKISHNQITLLTAEEQRRLCDYIRNNPTTQNIGIYVAMNTGVRIGELCALKWEDINLERRVLRVSKTAQRMSCNSSERKTAVMITSPKTASSVREIPLPDYLVDFLKEYAGGKENYVLSGTSKIVEPRAMTYCFKRALKEADLPSIKFHSLRHSFASKCLQAGFDTKTLSEILGHADVTTTMKIYVHSSMERKRECMSLLKPAA